MCIIPTAELHNAIIENHLGLIYEIMSSYVQKTKKLDSTLFTKVDKQTYIVTYKGIGLQLNQLNY